MRGFYHRENRSSSILGVRGKKTVRIIALSLAALAVIAIAFVLISRSTSTMDSPELALIRRRGALLCGVLENAPGFSESGSGLEAELAKKLGTRLFPDKGDAASVLVGMNSRMMSAKISDASIDIAICMAEKDKNPSRYVYSESYYDDPCFAATSKTKSLNLENAQIGYISDSSLKDIMVNFAEENELSVELREYPTFETMLSALDRGDIQAVLVTDSYIRMNPEANLKGAQEIGRIQYAMACGTDMYPLIQIADELISDLKESGELQTLINQYIGG